MSNGERKYVNNTNKFLIRALICIGLVTIMPISVWGAEEQGNINLYEVFSNKAEQMKTQVGSQIYKWSMNLPGDAIIYKSNKANNFEMNTESYQSMVRLQVVKNESKGTLEEILYAIQTRMVSQYNLDIPYGRKEYVYTIEKDQDGKGYIRIVRSSQQYDYMYVGEVADSIGDYIENRIYIENEYIYNLEIEMGGKFFQEHPEMFEKLISSFIVSFDSTNPHIKELSDSVSTERIHRNESYGWEINVKPYWRAEGIPGGRIQHFGVVYSDEELYGVSEEEVEKEDKNTIEEIQVYLISSIEQGQTLDQWVEKEIQYMSKYQNKKTFTILSRKSEVLGQTPVVRVVIEYQGIKKEPFIQEYLYTIGNGYKYRVIATIPYQKYTDEKVRKTYSEMLDSFRLIDAKSKYLGNIQDTRHWFVSEEWKTVKMKQYTFSTKIPKSWAVFDKNQNLYDNNQEMIHSYQPYSRMDLTMVVGLNTQDFKEFLKDVVKRFIESDEVRAGLADIKIASGKQNGVEVYRVHLEYNMDTLEKFMELDKTKKYEYNDLLNEYIYVAKIGNDVYLQNIRIPLANITSESKKEAESIWSHTEMGKMNISKLISKWKEHVIKEFENEKK